MATTPSILTTMDPGPNVDVNDIQRVHRRLDAAVLDILEDMGYVEDTRVQNVRLFVGAIAVAVGIYSHFNPYPFPQNRGVLLACVVVYILLSFALHMWMTYVEGDILFVSNQRRGGVTLRVRTGIPQFGTRYTLKVEAVSSSASSSMLAPYRAPSHKSWESVKGIGFYFTRDGLLYPPRLLEEINAGIKAVV